VDPPVSRTCGVEDVFGDCGQVNFLADGEPALVARQDEQRSDEMLGVIHGGADVRGHGAQVPRCAVRVARYDVDRRSHDGERGAQLVGCVGDELPLAVERGLETANHLVECLGQFAERSAGRCMQGRNSVCVGLWPTGKPYVGIPAPNVLARLAIGRKAPSLR